MNDYNSWADTLDAYLEASNEDACFLETFERHILPQIASVSDLHWLEVGCGNGLKTLLQLRSLHRSGRFERIHLHIVEPSLFWLEHFRREHLAACSGWAAGLVFYEMPFEEYAQQHSAADLQYISFIHVLYDTPLTQSLLDWIARRPATASFFLAATVETEDSDFFRLRRQLEQAGIALSSAKGALFVAGLTALGFAPQAFLSQNKTCRIDLDALRNDDQYWFFAFLVGCSRAEFAAYPEDLQNRVRAITRAYLQTAEVNPEDCTYGVLIA